MRITATQILGPNDRGGVSVILYGFNNDPDRFLRNVEIIVEPLNAQNEVVKCQMTGESRIKLLIDGPHKPFGTTTTTWNNVWYSTEIKGVNIISATIEYGDGSTRTMTGAEMLEDPFDKNNGGSGGGCYVATAVYGSYDCPEVWTLRRFRDYTLATSWYGRAFVKTYYAISPTLVKWFGKQCWFKRIWKNVLDRMVAKLHANGVESLPYDDKKW